MAELYLFNKEEVLINIIPQDDFNNDSHVRELNSKWSFEFTTTFQYLNDLSKSNKVGFYDRYREFRLFKIIKEPEVDYLSDEVVVNCLKDCYEMSDQIIEDKRLRDGTARQALDKVLEGSSYEVGEVAELGNRTINFYDISRMEGLNNIIKSYGGELDYRIEFDADFKRISHKYVDIKSRLGQDTGLRFTYDLNLESVVRKDVSESHCTVLYGRGGAIESGDGYSRKIKFTDVEWKKPTNPIDKPIGQTYIEDLDAIAKYGRIEGIYENSDIEEPGELLQATYEALQECKNPKLSYEVNAKDLASQNSDYDHLTVVLGDSVILLDEDYDLNLESRIVGFEESIKEESAEMKWIIGNVQSSFSSDNESSGQILKPSTGDVDIEIDDDKFPDALPDVPIIEAEGLFGSVIISWTYESKSYYEYELYASKLENFNPDASNLIFRGKASSYHHQVKPSETWYYRARAINTHGRTTDFSSQVQASTLKIEDGTEYFEKAAIADALIGELRLDRGWVGQLRGNWIDAKQLSVTDGNGKRTLDIDSFGNVNLDVASLKIKSSSVATESSVSNAKKDAINSANNTLSETISNYYTKTETDSNINIAKNAVITSVSTLRNEVMSATYANLLENSDFLILDSGFPRGYSSYTYGDSSVTMSDWVLQGAKAVKITSSGKTAYHWVSLFSPFVKTIQGQQFTASAWVATNSYSNIDEGCLIEIEWYGDGNNRISTSTYLFYPNVDTWERVTVTGWSPNRTTRARVRISVQQNGDLYATKLMLQAGGTATAWTRGGDFETITDRISYAEQKITDESITNTVKQSFYTKSETENAITSKGYATQAQLTQTSTQFEYKFSQSGGYNLIRNGNPKPWHEENWWVSGNGWWYRGNSSDLGIQTSDTNEAYAGTATFKVQPGTNYSLSCWLFAEHNTKGSDVYFIGSSEDNGAHEDVQHLFSGGKDGWTKVERTFTTGPNTQYGFIRIDNNGIIDVNAGYNVVFFSEVQLVNGWECYPQWSPNPNEIFDGIVKVNKDGIEVGKSNSPVTTQMDNDGFYVRRGNEMLLSATSSGLNISGYATTSSLATANGTIINGANIRTGVLSSQNGNLQFNLDNGRMHLYNGGSLLSTVFTMKDNRTGVNGMGILARNNSFIGLGMGDNDDNTLYNPFIVLAGQTLGNEYKKGINIKETIHGHFCKASNLGLEWKDFKRSRDDYASIYSTNQNSSNSKLIVEIGNDYTSSFEIHHKLYTNSSPITVATFRATGGSEYNPSANAGINFYQNLDMHGYRIWGASTFSAEDIEVTNLSFETRASVFLADEDVNYTAPICLLANMEHFGSAEMKNGSAMIELPLGFMHSGYVVVVCPKQSGNYRIEKSDDHFNVYGDIESFDYIIKGEMR